MKAYKWVGVLDSVSRGPSSDCVEVIRTIYTKDETNSYLRAPFLKRSVDITKQNKKMGL